MLRSEASWRRQLLTQPPIHSIRFNARKVVVGSPGAAGITLQDFIDAYGSDNSWDAEAGFVTKDFTGISFLKVCPEDSSNFEMLQEVRKMKYAGPWNYDEEVLRPAEVGRKVREKPKTAHLCHGRGVW